MSELLVWRKRIQEFYAKHSRFIDKGFQFLIALITFFVINNNIGVMQKLASPVISFGMAAICTVLPPVFTVLAAAALSLAHMFELSLGIAGVSAMVFFVMFAFYCQFTPKKSFVIVLTAVAYCLKVPFVAAIAGGLMFSPIISVPVILGTVAYYMLAFMKNSAAAIANADGIMGQITLYVKAVFLNKEMWVACAAVVVCVCVVYGVRRMAIDYSWTIATAAGALVNVIVYVMGSMVFNINVSFVSLILGNVIAIGVGLVLQFIFFSVDYSRTEKFQFEDDEYYYYVKAVPKLTISEPNKVVKRINERKNVKNHTETRQRQNKEQPVVEEKSTEQILLEKSLQDELEIQNIIDKELMD